VKRFKAFECDAHADRCWVVKKRHNCSKGAGCKFHNEFTSFASGTRLTKKQATLEAIRLNKEATNANT
jgi:hypothetical protein